MINENYPPKKRPNQATRRPVLLPTRKKRMLHLDSVFILLAIAVVFLLVVLGVTFL